MSRYEQLGRNPTNCFTWHKNRHQGGPERDGRRNDLRHRHTIADRIFRTDKATSQLGIRESFKSANRENQASSDYATRRQEDLRVPRARNITVRHDASGGPLQPPYDGPYQVTQRGTKTFTVKINNKNVIVSIDRLKPAFIVSDDIEQQQLETSAETHDTCILRKTTTTQNAERAQQSEDDSRVHHTTRAGRKVRFPDRFQAGLR